MSVFDTLGRVWCWVWENNDDLLAPERFMVDTDETSPNSQVHSTRVQRSSRARKRGILKNDKKNVDGISKVQTIGRDSMAEDTGEVVQVKQRTQARTRSFYPTHTRKSLFVLANIFLTLTVSIFVAPRISCTTFPALLQRYCPSSSTPTSAIDFDLVAPVPTISINPDRNLACSAQGAIPLPGMSFVGRNPLRRLWSGTLWRALRSQYTSAGLALTDDTQQCWEFSGRTAQIAIRLGDCAVIKRVVISHSSTHSPESAPRHIMVWGMVEGEENLGDLGHYTHLSANLATLFAKAATINPTIPAPVFHDHMFLPLLSLTYDPTGPREQVFGVFREIEALGVDFGVVVIQIMDNWGASTTSICRIGVYGTRLV